MYQYSREVHIFSKISNKFFKIFFSTQIGLFLITEEITTFSVSIMIIIIIILKTTDMDLSAWSKGLPPSANFCLDAQYISVQPDALLSEPDTTEMKNESVETQRKLLPYFQYHVCDAACSFIHFGRPEVEPSHDSGQVSAGGHHLSYAARNFNSGHRAKRARVENIIKGMTAAPAGHMREAATNEASVGLSQVTKTHLECRQLRVGTNPTACRESPGTSVSLAQAKPNSELEKNSKVNTEQMCEPTNLARSKPQQQIKLMAEVLKYELSRAVSRSVDSIFRSLPPLQMLSDDDDNDGRSSSWPSVCGDNGAAVSEAQAEALSLVVQKVDQRRPGTQASIRRCDTPLWSGPSQQPRNVAAQHDVSLTKPELLADRWNSVKMRSKVNSRLARSLSVVGPPLRSLCLPLVKMESEELVRNSLYVGDVSF